MFRRSREMKAIYLGENITTVKVKPRKGSPTFYYWRKGDTLWKGDLYDQDGELFEIFLGDTKEDLIKQAKECCR